VPLQGLAIIILLIIILTRFQSREQYRVWLYALHTLFGETVCS
jgi:hypothetical protein